MQGEGRRGWKVGGKNSFVWLESEKCQERGWEHFLWIKKNKPDFEENCLPLLIIHIQMYITLLCLHLRTKLFLKLHLISNIKCCSTGQEGGFLVTYIHRMCEGVMGEREKYGLSRARRDWEIKKKCSEVSLTSRKTICCYLSHTNLLCPHLQRF